MRVCVWGELWKAELLLCTCCEPFWTRGPAKRLKCKGAGSCLRRGHGQREAGGEGGQRGHIGGGREWGSLWRRKLDQCVQQVAESMGSGRQQQRPADLSRFKQDDQREDSGIAQWFLLMHVQILTILFIFSQIQLGEYVSGGTLESLKLEHAMIVRIESPKQSPCCTRVSYLLQ